MYVHLSWIINEYFQDHPWFADIEWDKLYEMEAAFKPEVNGELDTQNFMKFDEVHSSLIASFTMFLASKLTLTRDIKYQLL